MEVEVKTQEGKVGETLFIYLKGQKKLRLEE
jgi:hypothetical protein